MSHNGNRRTQYCWRKAVAVLLAVSALGFAHHGAYAADINPQALENILSAIEATNDPSAPDATGTDASIPGLDLKTTDVLVSVMGSAPSFANLISLNLGGEAADLTRYAGNNFYSTISNISGSPESISNLITIAVPKAGTINEFDIATIALTTDIKSALTTVTINDPEKILQGSGVTLTTDGATSTQPIDSSGTATTSSTGDPEERNRKICVAFETGLQFCLDMTLLDLDIPPVLEQEAFEKGRDDAIQHNYVDAIRMMTEQMTNIMLQQLHILGTFFDAKNQMEAQRLFGAATAEAHRDYHPSEQLCAFGTLVGSTAIEQYLIKENTLAMNAIFQKRELLNTNTSASWGPFADFMARKEQFKSVYCDPNDSNLTLPPDFCDSGDSTRKNNDLDFYRTMDSKLTLDINFTKGGAPTEDEEDILALAKNLYANETLPSIPADVIGTLGNYREFNETRMLAAIRSVARYSFSTQASMRMEGSGIATKQLHLVMKNIGVPEEDIEKLIGANPSYFAQMDILTQKMFQDPSFIINLYSGPANVARMGMVLQGIRIMADRDKLEASLRREMLLSLILEMKIRERQKIVANRSD